MLLTGQLLARVIQGTRKYVTSPTSSTLAIWPRIRSHRLEALQRHWRLFAGWSLASTRKKSPCKELAAVGKFILRKGARGHKPYSTWSVGGRNLDQRICGIRERGISIPSAHKWLKSSLKEFCEVRTMHRSRSDGIFSA